MAKFLDYNGLQRLWTGITAKFIQNETDPIFTASAAHGITSSDITNWNSKTSNVGTITGIKMNGVSKGTSGVVDLGTVVTSETALSKGTTTGAGNAVTDISISGHQITLTKGTTFATQSDIDTSIASLVDSAPGTLDTLNELAAALGDDPNFATTISSQIGAKYSKPSGGIPKTDLASAVQTSLGLADTAVQSVTLTQNSRGTTVSVDGGTAIYLVSDASMGTSISGSDHFIAPSWSAMANLIGECDFRSYLSSDFTLNVDEEVTLSTTIKNAINSISGKANSADLATVATSGSYNDLSNKPTIPDAQIQSDWSQTTTTAKDYIKNKPNISVSSGYVSSIYFGSETSIVGSDNNGINITSADESIHFSTGDKVYYNNKEVATVDIVPSVEAISNSEIDTITGYSST